jgi:hypothetical protein
MLPAGTLVTVHSIHHPHPGGLGQRAPWASAAACGTALAAVVCVCGASSHASTTGRVFARQWAPPSSRLPAILGVLPNLDSSPNAVFRVGALARTD